MPPAHARTPDPTDYATPRTIRPYSLGQNAEWDAVSRMLAAGLVTVAPDPMGMGFVRVCAVPINRKGPETHG